MTTIKTQLYKIMTQSVTCFDPLGVIIRLITKTYSGSVHIICGREITSYRLCYKSSSFVQPIFKKSSNLKISRYQKWNFAWSSIDECHVVVSYWVKHFSVKAYVTPQHVSCLYCTVRHTTHKIMTQSPTCWSRHVGDWVTILWSCVWWLSVCFLFISPTQWNAYS